MARTGIDNGFALRDEEVRGRDTEREREKGRARGKRECRDRSVSSGIAG